MTTGTKQLSIHLDTSEKTELVKLGLRCTVTAKVLAAHAVRQVLAAARGDAALVVPLLDTAEGPKASAGVTITLQATEWAALDALAGPLAVTPEALGRAAVLGLLEAAKAGAVPMVKPMEEAPPRASASWEELHTFWNLWDAEHLGNPEDLPEQVPLRPARINFRKAAYIVERLTRLAEEGIDPANPRAPLDDIDRLHTVVPQSL